MRKRNTATLLLLPAALLFILSGIQGDPADKKKDRDNLARKYQEWLKLVNYIITPVEENVFDKLTNDRERDIFIKAFWKQRDPTEGTPQNEYKEEHIRRFNYANKYYGRTTSRPGWMTDRGKYYILLGQPNSIERFEMTEGIRPTQVWYYYGDRAKGFPTHFALVFFKKHGAGEFRLYNPSSDGPMALLNNPEGLDYTNSRQQYYKIRELAPTLARVSLTNIPGQIPYNYNPSLRSNMLFAKIEESPKKEVKASYASHFLDYKGYVSTDYLTNYIDSAVEVNVVKDSATGLNFVHFSMAPQKISLDYFEPNDQYYCNYNLNVSLRKDEQVIYQYSKEFPFYFEEKRIPEIKNAGISIQDSFPAVEGQYNLTLLIQNSVAKEFSVHEEEISIPGDGQPRITEPLVGYGSENNASYSHFPYKVENRKILVDPKNVFSLNDRLVLFFSIINVSRPVWESGTARVVLKGSEARNPVQKTFSIPLKSLPYAGTVNVVQPLPTEELIPDYYELSIGLNKGGEPVDSRKQRFVISPKPQVAHPISLYNIFSLTNRFLYYYTQAQNYSKISEPEKAEQYFRKAYDLKPDYHEGVVVYAEFLIGQEKFPQALDLLEGLKENQELKFDYYLLRGRAFMGMEKYERAVETLLKGNQIYDSDIRLLNALGFCLYKTARLENALEALKASLRLNPEQKQVIRLIQRIEKEKNKESPKNSNLLDINPIS